MDAAPLIQLHDYLRGLPRSEQEPADLSQTHHVLHTNTQTPDFSSSPQPKLSHLTQEGFFRKKNRLLGTSVASIRLFYVRITASHLQVCLAPSAAPSCFPEEQKLDHSLSCGLFICACSPFNSSGAAAVRAAYVRTVGAYQSGGGLFSHEDHVACSCRCIRRDREGGNPARNWRNAVILGWW